MTVASIDIARFTQLAQELSPLVFGAATDASVHIETDADSYCCASWRLHGNCARELFVEQPGRAIAPGLLRVGIYFQDVLTLASPELALAELPAHRGALESLGVFPTFTPGYRSRDDVQLSWSEPDLARWCGDASAHRDLVRRFDLRHGEPSGETLVAVVVALLPIWRAWNAGV